MAQKYEEFESKPSMDRTGRFPTDAFLRAYGFKILKREDGRQAVWERSGQEYLQSEALEVIAEGEHLQR